MGVRMSFTCACCAISIALMKYGYGIYFVLKNINSLLAHSYGSMLHAFLLYFFTIINTQYSFAHRECEKERFEACQLYIISANYFQLCNMRKEP